MGTTTTFDIGLKGKVAAAAYCRVSTDSQDQDESYESQIAFFNSMIEANPGWTNAGIYAERESGRSTLEREEFQRMMKDAKDRKFNLLLTKSVSRFSRNVADCVECIRKLKTYGVNVYFTEQQFYTGGQYSEIILTMLAAIAEMESDSIGENISQIHRVMNGMGTPVIVARYGYRRRGKGWEIVPSEAERVKLAFLMAGYGHGFSEIARRLNKLEEAERTKKRWASSSVRSMLLSENYVGDILTNKSTMIKTRDGRRRAVQNDGIVDQFYIDDHHEGIVGRELYESVKELVEGGFMKGQRHSGQNQELADRARQAADSDRQLDSIRRYYDGKCSGN